MTTSSSTFLRAETISKSILIFSLFTPLFSSLKTIMFIQKESLTDFCKYIKETYTIYGSVIIEKQNFALKTSINGLKKVEKELMDSFSLISGVQGRYYIECKNAENTIIEYENLKDDMIPTERFIYEDTMKKKIQFAKESESVYLNSLTNANAAIENYVSTSTTIMRNLKKLDKEIVESFQNCLQQFYVKSLRRSDNEKSQLQEQSQTIEQIPYSTMYENKNTFQIYLPDKIAFSPYQLSILKENEKLLKDTKEIRPLFDKKTHDMIVKMKSEFKNLGENYNDKKESIKFEIARISRFIIDNIHNTPISEADKKFLYTYLNQSEFRLQLLMFLNLIRAAGKFRIGKQSFKQLGHIMTYIVDRISEDKDFESMRYLLIMCQTYYFINKDKKKFYLVRYIENHNLFQSNEFWEFYFSDSIFQEIEKQNKSEDPENETQKEKDKRFSNIVFSKLLSIAHNMMEFQIDKKQIQNLITIFSKQYSVDEDLEKQIITMIDEIQYDKKEPFNEEKDLTEEKEEEEKIEIIKNKDTESTNKIISENYFDNV